MVLFILFSSKKKKLLEINCGGNDFLEDFHFFYCGNEIQSVSENLQLQI